MRSVAGGKQTESRTMDIDARLSIITSSGGPTAFDLTREEVQSFLQIIERSLHVKRHYDLFQLVQGQVQDFIPHRILISAWGDFGSADIEVDVISAIPGVRTNRLSTCDVRRLLFALYFRWLEGGRRPLLLLNTIGELVAESNCRCSVHMALRGMGAGLVHGNHNARDGADSLYVALNVGPISKRGMSIERFLFLTNLIVSQLDTAFRKVTALKRHIQDGPRPAPRRGGLSLREEEIIDWVASGRSNAEISGILTISAFTVKNHVRQIMKKLGAANRTEAVALFRREVRDPRKRGRGEGAALPDGHS